MSSESPEKSFFSWGDHSAILLISVFISLVAALENGLILGLFFVNRKFLRTPHFYIISMAVGGVLVGLAGPPLSFALRYFREDIPLGFCPFVSFIKAVAHFGSFFCIVLTAFDRYWAIGHIFHYRQHATHKRAKRLVALGWMLAALIGVLFITVKVEGSGRTPRPSQSPCIAVNAVHPYILRALYWVVIPALLVTTIVAYVRIYSVFASTFCSKEGSKKVSIPRAMVTILQSSKQSYEVKEYRTTILFIITVVVFIVCWLPGTFLLFLITIDPKVAGSFMGPGVFMLYSVNAAFNPFLYATYVSIIRKSLDRIMDSLHCRSPHIEEDLTTATEDLSENSPKIAFPSFNIVVLNRLD